MLTINQVYAKKSDIDSLELKFKLEQLEDSAKLCLLMQRLEHKYAGSNDDVSLEVCLKALKLAELINHKEYQAEISSRIGSIYDKQEEYKLALRHYQKAKEIHAELADSLSTATSLYDISRIYWRMGHYFEVLENVRTAKEIFAERGAQVQLAKCLSLIGLTYNNLWLVRRSDEDYKAAKENFTLALSIYEQLEDQRGKASVMHNFGILEAKVNHYDLALNYYKKSLAIGKSLNDAGLIAENQIFIGQTYGYLNQTENAIRYVKEGLQSYREIGEASRISRSLRILAGIYFNIRQYSKAITYAEEAFQIGQTLEALPLVKEASEILYKSYNETGNIQKALDYLKVHIEVKDRLLGVKHEKELAELMASNNLRTKEVENKLLRYEGKIRKSLIDRQRIIIFGTIIILLILFLFTFFLIRAWRIQRYLLDKIEKLNQSQNRWFSNIAHELRTPLTLILGPIGHFIKKYGEDLDSPALANLRLVEKNSMRLMNLINEVLDFYKLESGQMHVENRVFSLNSLLSQVADYFLPAFKEKYIEHEIILPAESIHLKTDARKIEAILINLISNAIKFTDKGGNISILFEREENYDSISVIDSGKGISEKDLNRIFDRYYQVANSSNETTSHGGSGIGLALSKEMAKLLGAEIKVFSRLGVGSKFTLQLPPGLRTNKTSVRVEGTLISKLPSNHLENSIPSNQISGWHILLIEDNRDMQEYMASMLSHNYNVSMANDGRMALQLLTGELGNAPLDPDLIITDLMMPVMDGFTFIQKFKELFPERRIPFVILTARVELNDKLKGLTLGINDYITKPFNQDEFMARIDNLLVNSTYRKQESTITVPSGVVLTDSESLPPSYAEELLNRIKQEVEVHMRDSQLSVETLADAIGMHKKTLTRTLKKALGLTPGKFIRELRLRRALRYLESGTYPTVNEVANAVGFESPSNFTYAFYQRYGKKPSEYMQKS